MFVIDLFSSIPYRYVALIIPFISSISFLKILKIARISRFTPFVEKLELNEEDKAVSLTHSHDTYFYCFLYCLILFLVFFPI